MSMTIEKAIHELINEYNRVKDNVGIRKPVSFALYSVWKYADKNEKERPINYKKGIKKE